MKRKEDTRLSKGKEIKIGDEVYVNDLRYVCKIVKKSNMTASLVIEEDDEINWYCHPDENSDEVIKTVFVQKIRER